MRSKAAIFGHPLHPMLVSLPIGLLVGSVAADIIYLITGRNTMWYDIAFWTAIFGVVTALAAAVVGFVDYFLLALRTDARTPATVHMGLNLAVVALFLISIVLRLEHGALSGGRFTLAFILSLVGIGLLSVSGWLGGELAYRHHLGIIPDSREAEEAEEQRHTLSRAA